MSKVIPDEESGSQEWNLTENWKAENMNIFFGVAMLAGTGLIAGIILGVRPAAFGYIGIVGLLSASMWMPYLMALIYYNGMYKKLAYAPLTAPTPPWVKRAMVAHNNSLENFMLYAIAIIFALGMGVQDADIRGAAAFYFATRYHPSWAAPA